VEARHDRAAPRLPRDLRHVTDTTQAGSGGPASERGAGLCVCVRGVCLTDRVCGDEALAHDGLQDLRKHALVIPAHANQPPTHPPRQAPHKQTDR
jgi:hypothetical protein